MNAIRTLLQTAVRLARAAALSAVLFGVVGGLPVGLWHFFGRPFPSHGLGLAEVESWFDQLSVFPMQSAIQVLVFVAWVCWAVFTVQIAVQLPGAVRDAVRCARTQTAMPSTSQLNLAGRLLAAVAISFIATRGSIGAASAATAADNGAPMLKSAGVVATATTRTPVHVVAVGECLWDIANSRLGDGNRWREIFDLNRHRVQADGGVLADPDVIHAGWTLALPAKPGLPGEGLVAPAPAPAPPPPAPAAGPAPAPAPAVTLPPSSSAPASPSPDVPAHQAPAAFHRRVAVRLPSGSYVSLTLGAGLAAAIAAATIRTRAASRRDDRRGSGPSRPQATAAETTLLQAAAMLGHVREEDIDPYVDSPADSVGQLPPALAALRAPAAVYVGVRDGYPIPAVPVIHGGLGIDGAGALDAARALLTSALAAGGYLADSAAFTLITTIADLKALVGRRYEGQVADRLIVRDGYDAAEREFRSFADSKTRPLLIATRAERMLVVGAPDSPFLDTPDHATVAVIDADGSIHASGRSAAALDGAEAYRLNLEEAGELFDRILAGLGVVPATVPSQAMPVEPAQPVAANRPDPQPASGDTPTDPEAVLTVNVLGPLQVLANGRDVTALFRPMTAALLIQLAVNRRGVTRSALAADLWLDVDPDTRRQRFKSTLSHARTALAQAHGAKADFITEAKPSTILALNPDLITVDAWRADELLDLRRLHSAASTSDRIAMLLDGIALHRGSLAAGHENSGDRIVDAVWLTPHREASFQRLVDVHQDAANLLRASEPDHAIVLLERAAELEPWNTSVTEQIIEIHVEQGQYHAAARRLRLLSDHLAVLRMQPSDRIVALVESARV